MQVSVLFASGDRIWRFGRPHLESSQSLGFSQCVYRLSKDRQDFRPRRREAELKGFKIWASMWQNH